MWLKTNIEQPTWRRQNLPASRVDICRVLTFHLHVNVRYVDHWRQSCFRASASGKLCTQVETSKVFLDLQPCIAKFLQHWPSPVKNFWWTADCRLWKNPWIRKLNWIAPLCRLVFHALQVMFLHSSWCWSLLQRWSFSRLLKWPHTQICHKKKLTGPLRPHFFPKQNDHHIKNEHFKSLIIVIFLLVCHPKKRPPQPTKSNTL